ncbi:hypothetical protein [Shewanella sedimentimangrovi]|uniref:Uncharacterized protein n=1 Tax=Shewanella sedimentimangrovi TaxID=2814293 RepID=A0ABX7QZQ9_9GAMM|nr:hypothetical protein [Shewanella sedimentimangrovi]QSX36739.1 hypothetical protein JYB85_15895 [Shewanella sedimentimangrovi]
MDEYSSMESPNDFCPIIEAVMFTCAARLQDGNYMGMAALGYKSGGQKILDFFAVNFLLPVIPVKIGARIGLPQAKSAKSRHTHHASIQPMHPGNASR